MALGGLLYKSEKLYMSMVHLENKKMIIFSIENSGRINEKEQCSDENLLVSD